MIEMTRIDACSNIPAPSKVTDSIAAVVEALFRTRISEASERTSAVKVMKSCELARAERGAKASISTPISAPARTISIGARSAYSSVGDTKLIITCPH